MSRDSEGVTQCLVLQGYLKLTLNNLVLVWMDVSTRVVSRLVLRLETLWVIGMFSIGSYWMEETVWLGYACL